MFTLLVAQPVLRTLEYLGADRDELHEALGRATGLDHSFTESFRQLSSDIRRQAEALGDGVGIAAAQRRRALL